MKIYPVVKPSTRSDQKGWDKSVGGTRNLAIQEKENIYVCISVYMLFNILMIQSWEDCHRPNPPRLQNKISQSSEQLLLYVKQEI